MRVLFLLWPLLAIGFASGQVGAQELPAEPPVVSWKITPKSIGGAKLGETVSKARKALPGMRLKHETGADGVALIGVWKGSQELMTLFAGEDDPNRPIHAIAKIVQIEALNPRYRTQRGIHPGMLLREVEKKYGKLLKIQRSEVEGLEYAAFTHQETGIQLKVATENGTAGIYPNGKASPPVSTTRYKPDAKIIGIVIQSQKS